MKAFILCAGFGERLRPVTEEIPKPLVPVLGKPLIYYALEKLKSAGIKEIGINLHWLPEKIKKYLENFKKDFNFHFFYEKELLDTGGALKNAEKFLKDDQFIVINGDIILNFSIKNLIEFHKENKNFSTLLITDNRCTNNLKISKDGELLFVSNNFSKKYKTFCGIGIYEPDILNLMEKKKFSIKETWQNSIKNGKKIKTFYIDKENWKECGNVNSYLKTLFFYLKKSGEKNFINRNARINKIELKGLNIIEENVILNDLTLENSVIFPQLKLNKSIKNKFIGKNFEIDIPKSLYLDIFISKDKFLLDFKRKKFVFLKKIYSGGSKRTFFSFKKGKKDYILMDSSQDYREFNRLIDMNKFLNKSNFPVPEIIKISIKEKKLIMNDCGEYSLYDLSKFLKIEEIEKIYKKIIEKVAILHNIKAKEGFFSNYIFNKEYFLWESRYFFENFIINYLNLDINYEFFKNDFEKLSEISSSFEKRILHRDLQSQNILIKENKITFVDYQSARLGPPGYDISSLLWDPYLLLPENLRKNLLCFYKERMGADLPSDFEESLKYLKIQRHLQALGAYGFLGIKMKKTNFLKYIKPALNLLIEDLAELKTLNSLNIVKQAFLKLQRQPT